MTKKRLDAGVQGRRGLRPRVEHRIHTGARSALPIRVIVRGEQEDFNVVMTIGVVAALYLDMAVHRAVCRRVEGESVLRPLEVRRRAKVVEYPVEQHKRILGGRLRSVCRNVRQTRPVLEKVGGSKSLQDNEGL